MDVDKVGGWAFAVCVTYFLLKDQKLTIASLTLQINALCVELAKQTVILMSISESMHINAVKDEALNGHNHEG